MIKHWTEYGPFFWFTNWIETVDRFWKESVFWPKYPLTFENLEKQRFFRKAWPEYTWFLLAREASALLKKQESPVEGRPTPASWTPPIDMNRYLAVWDDLKRGSPSKHSLVSAFRILLRMEGKSLTEILKAIRSHLRRYTKHKRVGSTKGAMELYCCLVTLFVLDPEFSKEPERLEWLNQVQVLAYNSVQGGLPLDPRKAMHQVLCLEAARNVEPVFELWVNDSHRNSIARRKQCFRLTRQVGLQVRDVFLNGGRQEISVSPGEALKPHTGIFVTTVPEVWRIRLQKPKVTKALPDTNAALYLVVLLQQDIYQRKFYTSEIRNLILSMEGMTPPVKSVYAGKYGAAEWSALRHGIDDLEEMIACKTRKVRSKTRSTKKTGSAKSSGKLDSSNPYLEIYRQSKSERGKSYLMFKKDNYRLLQPLIK